MNIGVIRGLCKNIVDQNRLRKSAENFQIINISKVSHFFIFVACKYYAKRLLQKAKLTVQFTVRIQRFSTANTKVCYYILP
jgi:hypothetical protein